MCYSNYKKIKSVVKKFKLNLKMVELFDQIEPKSPSPWLTETLKKAKIMALTNEKGKSERIISPILVELAEQYQEHISLFSGENLDINPSDDLAGECDFFFSLHPMMPYIDAPIITLVEAKNENVEQGLAQCAAQLYGAKLFNEAEGKAIPTLFGCATTGTDWHFMRFENDTFYLDKTVYTNLQEILGIWNFIIQSFLD